MIKLLKCKPIYADELNRITCQMLHSCIFHGSYIEIIFESTVESIYSNIGNMYSSRIQLITLKCETMNSVWIWILIHRVKKTIKFDLFHS